MTVNSCLPEILFVLTCSGFKNFFNFFFTGVEITDTTLQIHLDTFKQGNLDRQSLSMCSWTLESSAGSVSGTNLWSIAAFGSDNSFGTGSKFQETVVPTSGIQGTVGIDAGTTVPFPALF